MSTLKLPPIDPEYLERIDAQREKNAAKKRLLARNPSGRRVEQRRQREEAIAFEDRRVAQHDRRSLKRRKRDQG